MRKADINVLFDYSYWVTRQVLAAAAELSSEDFTAGSDMTWRTLRGTLVHTLDVERSWRGRLRRESPDVWDASLPEEDYPTVDSLVAHWERDEAEMRAWLEGLNDESLTEIVDLGDANRFPLWYFLLHVVTHSTNQRRDAVLLITRAGRDTGELDFLYYADWLREHRGSSSTQA